VHSVHYTFPLFARVGHAVTIHDLTFFTHPELHTRFKRLFFRTWITICRRFGVTAITPSAATASEYTRITGASTQSVTVAHLGIDSSLFHPPTKAATDALRARLDLPNTGWVAFLGTLEPRKNVTALVDGYAAALDMANRSDRPPLLIAGGAGWDDTVGPAIARAIGAGADVRLLGYLPLHELNAFLGGADIVAYPSLGEGFGLPVLEAMASGACVLTTRELSLPEVGGDAVAYTGTGSLEIATALASLLDSPDRRRELSSRASSRASRFTWDASAGAHLVAYDKAAS
jgi:glycosyltransferase involved in cell wall biosynthesis